jgi:hypothetical protein
MLPQNPLAMFVIFAKSHCFIPTNQLFASVAEAANAAE